MNGSCESPTPQLCSCCAGTTNETPQPITNRPALSAIAYRVGTYPTFNTSLLAGLSSSDLPGLVPLRTRDNSDFSIAMLDAWSVVLDILTFYQERFANEAYLRTAVKSFSVRQLARLVGYQPSPGVSASTLLSFTLNSAPGAPDNVLIPAATRVQSVPGPGQSPQVFETSEDLTALQSLNAIPARTTLPWELNPNDTSTWLAGTNNNINVGDVILFVTAQMHAAAVAGTSLTAGKSNFRYVTSVTVDSNLGNTLIEWDQPLIWPNNNDSTAYVYTFRKKAALFGVQAPDPRMLSTSGSHVSNLRGYPSGGDGDWTFQYTKGSHEINLDSSYAGLNPPKGGEPQWTLLVAPGECTALFQINAASETGPLLYTLTSKTTQLRLTLAQVLVSDLVTLAEETVAAALKVLLKVLSTGWNWFLIWRVEPQNIVNAINNFETAVQALQQALAPPTTDGILSAIVEHTRNTTAYLQAQLLTPVGPPYYEKWSHDSTYARQRGTLKPVEGSALEIVTGRPLSNGQALAVAGRRLRLQVNTAGQPTDSHAGFTPMGSSSVLPLADGQIFLVDAFPPVAAPTGKDQLWSVITADGQAGTLEISTSDLLLVPADSNDPVTGEIASVSHTSTQGSDVTLTLASPLARIYDRETVTANVNVVEATHGETMNEILGSGDATNSAGQFTLKQSPLTYVTAPSGLGAQSTLQVWVNNVEWHEVDNFLDSAPADRVFVTQDNHSGVATVQFGNGVTGARTPTGQMNIRAVYRKGIGAAGNVVSGQLSQAIDRPAGLKGVTNPDAATGGADPDTADDARASAPLHVLTLDRVVSLEDYQNFARAFAGIAKSLATWTWFGRTRGVFLTVAGAGGTVLAAGNATLSNLQQALLQAGNPYVPLQVTSFQSVLFEVSGNVRIDTSDYDPTQVLAQVWQALSSNLGFAQRDLGQGVAASEIIALIHQVPGVIAVELTQFNRRGKSTPAGTALPAVLRASSPEPSQRNKPQGAELLTLDPASRPNLKEWK